MHIYALVDTLLHIEKLPAIAIYGKLLALNEIQENSKIFILLFYQQF